MFKMQENALCETRITWIPKLDNNITTKKNYRAISLMSVDVEIHKKILANRAPGGSVG